MDLANYETLVDVRKAIDVKKYDLTNIKPNVDKSDIGKWKTISTYLSNLKSNLDKLMN